MEWYGGLNGDSMSWKDGKDEIKKIIENNLIQIRIMEFGLGFLQKEKKKKKTRWQIFLHASPQATADMEWLVDPTPSKVFQQPEFFTTY